MNYISQDSKLPPYLPYPRFLLSMKLTQTAQLVYTLLLDRATLSQKTHWQDGQGHIYVIFPITHLAKELGKGVTSIKSALSELNANHLIQRKRAGPGQPNRIYVLVPDSRKTGPLAAGEPAIRGPTTRPSSGQETGLVTAEKPATNNLMENDLIHNNL